MQESLISWTKVTWNPVHGCSVVSEGCRNCYAATLSLRYGHTTKAWIGKNAAENVMLKPHKLREPYRLKEPSKVFVNSMSDLFHEQVADEYIKKVFDVMYDLPQHTFQVLTKRPERAAEWDYKWQFNIQIGTSVEDARVKHRIDTIRQSKALIKFISFEPLIADMGELDLTGIQWAIVGGESGQGYREMKHEWARNVRDSCLKYDTAFFFKQSSAFVTERGTALQHEDGTFWRWEQFPFDRTPPIKIEDIQQIKPLPWQRDAAIA
jgi:protein gp37